MVAIRSFYGKARVARAHFYCDSVFPLPLPPFVQDFRLRLLPFSKLKTDGFSFHPGKLRHVTEERERGA